MASKPFAADDDVDFTGQSSTQNTHLWRKKKKKTKKFVIHVAVTGDLDDEDNADDLSDSKCDRRRNFGQRRLGRDIR